MSISFVRASAISLGLALGFAAAPHAAAAQGSTTTGTVRGTVRGPAAKPLADVTVIATNQETGVRRAVVTRPGGEYRIGFLDPGLYTVKAQIIGYRPVQTPNLRVALGGIEKLDFELTEAATQLSTVKITAEISPLIETNKTGSNTRIGSEQIAAIPLNGRNYRDLVKLTPGTSDIGSAGSGGGQSVGGGRTGASNIMMDGTNNNETFFGGDARGGDRAPFSFSVETVKEIQVITNAVDVEIGSFTGGAVNAVTKSGTNKWSGAAWMYGRADNMFGRPTTGKDFLGRDPTNFERQQYGFQIAGPLLKDKFHFLFNFERQTGYDPRLVFVNPDRTDNSIRASGINPDTLANFLNIAQRVYGLNLGGEVGSKVSNSDETAVFARLDWQLNDVHHLTVRANASRTNLSNDRLTIGPTLTELTSNAGDNTDNSTSGVFAWTSAWKNFSNEFRAQYATVRKPRPSYNTAQFANPISQITVNNVNSVLSNGAQILTAIRFGSDPVLHANLLSSDLVEFVDNFRVTIGNHNLKFGANFTGTDVYNKFRNNELGTWSFNSMADFENGLVNQFTRAIPVAGQSSIIDAQFRYFEYAAWAQDEWQLNPKLFVTYGLRFDGQQAPDVPLQFGTLTSIFPYISTTNMPIAATISPRIGITYDPDGDGRQLFRASTSIIYGRNPYVTISNAFVNNGLAQSAVSCTGAAAPSPNFAAFGANPSSLPSACVGAGAPPAAPTINAFDADYKPAYSWKTNIGYDREIVDGWRVSVEGVLGVIRQNFLVQDDNLNPVPNFTELGGIPVFVDPTSISATGATNTGFSRRSTQFGRVLVHRSLGSTLVRQGWIELRGRGNWGQLYAQYTYDNSADNGSTSCCITNSMFGAGRWAGNPNNYNDQWAVPDFQRTHTLVITPTFYLPLAIQLSNVFTVRTGVSWTPQFGSDIQGVGSANTRQYVPTEGDIFFGGSTVGFAAPLPMGTNAAGAGAQDQRELLNAVIGNTSCISGIRGQIAQRNSCRNPDIVTLDMRLSRKFTLRGQTMELQFDWFNLGNALNSKWGRFVTVSGTNQSLLTARGFDQTTKRFTYQVNPTFGQATPLDIGQTLQQQMQLGIRYSF